MACTVAPVTIVRSSITRRSTGPHQPGSSLNLFRHNDDDDDDDDKEEDSVNEYDDDSDNHNDKSVLTFNMRFLFHRIDFTPFDRFYLLGSFTC